ncbi:hypothetical protein [Streptomyces sp.]|uniref:hypothetical protein n=1 Tax=Streptomyces sp. TaxID=1931 RepID=UPI002D76EC75|nr:hypothetical protein [Streptomyces sp.]HET6354168.1 hypothetical protein [Streptomyces sp.]
MSSASDSELSLLDITLTTGALQDEVWLQRARTVMQRNARVMHDVLAERFDELVVPAGLHYRFVHLLDPHTVHAHLARCGIAVRLFDGSGNGASGIRVMASVEPAELAHLSAALETLPAGWGRR